MSNAPRTMLILAFITLFMLALVTACESSNQTTTQTTTLTITISRQPTTTASPMVIVPDAPAVTPAGAPLKPLCTTCHGSMASPTSGGSDIVSMIDSGPHIVHDCTQCHTPGNHPGNPTVIKPVTNLSATLCGGCHPDQYTSFMTINLNSSARIEKGTPTGAAPLLDKLLAGHGFTVEHNKPRSHAFMLIDQTIVDRSYGGRFSLANWQGILSTGSVWDIMVDNGEGFASYPGTAKAANPVCVTCKTTDHILEWAYLGEENPNADWARTSVATDFVKSIDSPSMGCIMCHDPHTTSHRIVRDALIEATENNGTFPYMDDDGASLVQTEVITFRDYRKIALLDAPESNVLCAQCHVEYSCNPGTNPVTSEAITLSDARTNQFPWVNVFDLQAYYDTLQFRDFTHAITGAKLVKLQHPDAETHFNSTHQLAGVQCSDCHMPKMQNAAGETYTSHWQASPRNFLDKTCLTCHTEWTAEEAEYRINAIQDYTRGKTRNAEYWLERLIDTFVTAKQAGVSESVLNEARQHHEAAHIYWEWWTAENSYGFHNPEMARESLALSVEASKAGIAVLETAMR